MNSFTFVSNVDCGSLNRMLKYGSNERTIIMGRQKGAILKEIYKQLKADGYSEKSMLSLKINTPICIEISGGGRGRDLDNFSAFFFKALLDALVSSGLISDDNTKNVQELRVIMRPDLDKSTLVRVTSLRSCVVSDKYSDWQPFVLDKEYLINPEHTKVFSLKTNKELAIDERGAVKYGKKRKRVYLGKKWKNNSFISAHRHACT